MPGDFKDEEYSQQVGYYEQRVPLPNEWMDDERQVKVPDNKKKKNQNKMAMNVISKYLRGRYT